MKVTTKGQVTIPQEIRDQLGIRPGADVDFILEGDAVNLTAQRKAALAGAAVVEKMRGRGTVHMSTDEILALTRGVA